MPVSMYTVSVPVFIQHLNGLSTVLDKAAAWATARKVNETDTRAGWRRDQGGAGRPRWLAEPRLEPGSARQSGQPTTSRPLDGTVLKVSWAEEDARY